MKVDTKVKCNVRVSLCVTEERNDQNIPLMLYTPTKEDYVENVNLEPGMDQEETVEFDLQEAKLQKYELSRATHKYTPMIVSVNYSKHGKQYAFLSYYTFETNA